MLAKAPKKVFCIQVVPLLQFEDISVILHKKTLIFSKENSVLWSTVCTVYSKFLLNRASVYKLHYRNLKLKLDLRSQKAVSSLITITMSVNIQLDKFVYRSDLERKILNNKPINLFFQKLSTLTIENFTNSKRTDNTSQAILKYFRAITICSSFTLDCEYDNSTIILIVDLFWPYTKSLGKLCLQKKTFQSLGRGDYQFPHCASMFQVRDVLFEDQTYCIFLSFGQGVYIFDESSKSTPDVMGDVYCPGKYCFNRENCESFDGYVTTPRSFYVCGTCETWLFVHKVPLMLQEHLKTTITDKTRFFFSKKVERVTRQKIAH